MRLLRISFSRRKLSPIFTTVALAASFCTAYAGIAEEVQSRCGPYPAVLQSTQPNIFSAQQEQWLGDAMADRIDRFYRPASNPAENAYLKIIGTRLLAALPPTKIQFQFTLVDSSEVNGFSLAGGHVYLTRKLVASAHSEDEVAGVIAHEMGHILSHQFAIETTADFKRLLNVTSVTDRADVYAKFQQLIDARLHEKHPSLGGNADDKQDEADLVAVYAAAAAGYRPQAYAEFWDRSFFVDGKTGSRFTDVLHITTPSQKRLRNINALIDQLPAGCGVETANHSSAFEQWHALVIENQPAKSNPADLANSSVASAAAAPLTDLPLAPPLRMSIDFLRFSRDGKYILAKDESSIFVLTRDPFKEVFRFDARDAFKADFSPDSQSISFYTHGLHVETWNIHEQKLISAHEVVTRQPCLQAILSPDGRSIACVFRSINSIGASLIDVDTGKTLYEKQFWASAGANFFKNIAINANLEVIPYSFSPDGDFLMMGSYGDQLAFDLQTRVPVKVGERYGFFGLYTFTRNDQVAAIDQFGSENNAIVSFPEGKLLKPFKFKFSRLQATTANGYLLVEGTPDFPGGVVELNSDKLVTAARTRAIDVFDDHAVLENPDGSLSLLKLRSQDPKDALRAALSLSPLAEISAASLSKDAHYLAVSTPTRSAVWDLPANKEIFLGRGFRSLAWTPEGKLFAEFAAIDKDHPRAIGEVSFAPMGIRRSTYSLADDTYLEAGRLMKWTADKKGYTLSASSVSNNTPLWSRFFTAERPGYTTNDGDTDLIFSYPLQSNLAKEKLKTSTLLEDQANTVKQKTAGRLIEIVNGADGTVSAQVVVEVPLTYIGVNGFNRVGEQLYLSVGDNRTIVYSLRTGAQLRQLFGSLVAADASGIICIANRSGEAIILDAAGVELQHVALSSSLRFADLRDRGSNLILLTSDQHLHRIPIANIITPAPATP